MRREEGREWRDEKRVKQEKSKEMNRNIMEEGRKEGR